MEYLLYLFNDIYNSILSVPDGPPEKVHCVALTSSTIQVSWHPPEIHLRNGIVKGYKVLYAPRPRAAPSAGLPVPKISRLSTVTTVLENLLKYSNYSIQVLAFTGAGDGLYSVPIDCATHSDGEGPPCTCSDTSILKIIHTYTGYPGMHAVTALRLTSTLGMRVSFTGRE